MADQAGTHSAHVDESMAEEVEALTRGAPVEPRAHESRMVEPPDGDVSVDAIIEFAAEPLPGALGETERRRRSELAIALRPHAFPGDRDKLLRVAEGERAPDWILEALQRLPSETRFDTPQEVWVALGGHREVRDVEPIVGQAPELVVVGPEPATQSSTGVLHDLAKIGLCAVRLPFVLVERGARAALTMLPEP